MVCVIDIHPSIHLIRLENALNDFKERCEGQSLVFINTESIICLLHQGTLFYLNKSAFTFRELISGHPLLIQGHEVCDLIEVHSVNPSEFK